MYAFSFLHLLLECISVKSHKAIHLARRIARCAESAGRGMSPPGAALHWGNLMTNNLAGDGRRRKDGGGKGTIKSTLLCHIPLTSYTRDIYSK
jgi:hypothetical protein